MRDVYAKWIEAPSLGCSKDNTLLILPICIHLLYPTIHLHTPHNIFLTLLQVPLLGIRLHKIIIIRLYILTLMIYSMRYDPGTTLRKSTTIFFDPCTNNRWTWWPICRHCILATCRVSRWFIIYRSNYTTLRGGINIWYQILPISCMGWLWS